jgi:hypothetical protein
VHTFGYAWLQRLHDGLGGAGGVDAAIGEGGTDLHPPALGALADAGERGESLHPGSDESAADESHGGEANYPALQACM